MQIKKFVLGILYTNCYLIIEGKEAVLIDSATGANQIIDYIKENKLRLHYILLTHGHGDHIGDIEKIKKTTGAIVLVHKLDDFMLRHPLNIFVTTLKPVFPDSFFLDGDIISSPNTKIKIKVIHTPGHSPGSVCFYLDKEGLLFSGDTLFCHAVGRTDIPKANHLDLVHSVRTRLFTLPTDTKVLPGHGKETTIGEETKSYLV